MIRVLAIVAAVIVSFVGGWFVNRTFPGLFTSSASPSPATNRASEIRQGVSRIIAQGKLQPSGGIVNILAPPGQQVTTVNVREGDTVVAGESELLQLESKRLMQLQSELASAQSTEATLQLTQARINADLAVRQARSTLDSAKLQYSRLKSDTEITIIKRELESARSRLADFQELAADTLTAPLVSRQQLAEQELKIRNEELRLEETERQRLEALKAAADSVNSAEESLADAQKAAQLAAQIESESRSTRLAAEIANEQLAQSRIIAPIDGTVLRVMIRPGETVTTLPLLQIGNTTRMECTAEVSELFAMRLKPGLMAVMKNPALPHDIQGTVVSVGRVIGLGTLPEPNPLALVDRKSVEVKIELDSVDVQIARNFVNLQVTVEIAADQAQMTVLPAPQTAGKKPPPPATADELPKLPELK